MDGWHSKYSVPCQGISYLIQFKSTSPRPVDSPRYPTYVVVAMLHAQAHTHTCPTSVHSTPCQLLLSKKEMMTPFAVKYVIVCQTSICLTVIRSLATFPVFKTIHYHIRVKSLMMPIFGCSKNKALASTYSRKYSAARAI